MDGLGRLVVHQGSNQGSAEAGRFMPFGALFDDVGEHWHWAEGLVAHRLVEGAHLTNTMWTPLRPALCDHHVTVMYTMAGIPVKRIFGPSKYMRLSIIPRMPGRCEAAIELLAAGAAIITMPLKRRLYEDDVWPRSGGECSGASGTPM